MKKVTTPISAPKYNPSLDKWDRVDLFPEKTANAREMLAKAPWSPRDEKSSSI